MLLHLKVKGPSRVAGGAGARLLRGPSSCPGSKRLAPCEPKSASRSRPLRRVDRPVLRLLSDPGGHRHPSRARDLKGVSWPSLDTRCAGRDAEALSHGRVGTGLDVPQTWAALGGRMAASGPLTPGASPAAGASAPLPRVTFPFWRWLVTVMVEPLASPSNASDFKAPFKERARRETRKCCLRSPCASDRTAERGGGAPCPAPGLGLRVSVAEDLGHCLLTPGPPSLFASSIRSLVHPSTATRGSHRLRPVRPHVGTSDFRACDGEGEKLGWSGRWGWGSGFTQQRPGGGGAAAGAGGDPGPLVWCCR